MIKYLIMFLCCAVVWCVPVIWLISDDELSTGSLELIAMAEGDGKESEAYLYFLGFGADADKAPIEVGRQLFKELRKSEIDKNYKHELQSACNKNRKKIT